jgi:predicted ester cyclase
MRRLLNKSFIQRYVDALSGRDKSLELVTQFVADKRLTEHIVSAEAAFPRYKIVVHDMVAEGDKVVVRGDLRGTHSGELMGIPPTQIRVTLSFTITLRIADGKIAEHWVSADVGTLLQQLRSGSSGAVTAAP